MTLFSRQVDAEGNLVDWWQPKTAKKSEKKTNTKKATRPGSTIALIVIFRSARTSLITFETYLILVTTATTGGSVLFSNRCTFFPQSTQNRLLSAKFFRAQTETKYTKRNPIIEVHQPKRRYANQYTKTPGMLFQTTKYARKAPSMPNKNIYAKLKLKHQIRQMKTKYAKQQIMYTNQNTK